MVSATVTSVVELMLDAERAAEVDGHGSVVVLMRTDMETGALAGETAVADKAGVEVASSVSVGGVIPEGHVMMTTGMPDFVLELASAWARAYRWVEIVAAWSLILCQVPCGGEFLVVGLALWLAQLPTKTASSAATEVFLVMSRTTSKRISMLKIPGTRREEAAPVRLGLKRGKAVEAEVFDVFAETVGMEKVVVLPFTDATGMPELAVSVGKTTMVASSVATVVLVLR